MKKYLDIELNTTELIGSIIIAAWIVASALVPLPEVCSLGM